MFCGMSGSGAYNQGSGMAQVALSLLYNKDVAMKKNIVRYASSAFLVLLTLPLAGCDFALFAPKGPVGEGIRNAMFLNVGLMLMIVIPTMLLAVYMVWRYRERTNRESQTEYDPDWEHSTKIELVVWGIPIAIILVLAIITYITSFSLDPREPLKSDKEKLTIQVVSMDWKWLFIYPEEGIATINEIAIPVDRPVEFLITSQSTMNSFFIPRLGGQLYAMGGMENRLNLMATEENTYRGISSNYSGYGFSGMRFKVHARSDAGYQEWVNSVKTSDKQMTRDEYDKLIEPTRDHPVEYFALGDPLLFKSVIERYTGVQNVK